jgi:hypothetical protein
MSRIRRWMRHTGRARQPSLTGALLREILCFEAARACCGELFGWKGAA